MLGIGEDEIGPALEVESVIAGNEISYVANAFTEAAANGGAQNDGRQRGPGGQMLDNFEIGQCVRIWSPDFANEQRLTIIAFDPVTRRVRFATPPPGSIALRPGQLVTWVD